MGEVFLGEDGRLGRQAAIKILPVEFCESAERRQRFLEEARSASAINHPNACVIYDVGETDVGQPFIAKERLVVFETPARCQKRAVGLPPGARHNGHRS